MTGGRMTEVGRGERIDDGRIEGRANENRRSGGPLPESQLMVAGSQAATTATGAGRRAGGTDYLVAVS